MENLDKLKSLIEGKQFDPSTAEIRKILLNAVKALDEFEQVKVQSTEMLQQAQGAMLKMQVDYWNLMSQHSQFQALLAAVQLEGMKKETKGNLPPQD